MKCESQLPLQNWGVVLGQSEPFPIWILQTSFAHSNRQSQLPLKNLGVVLGHSEQFHNWILKNLVRSK